MGKKKGGKSSGYVSKGERTCVAPKNRVHRNERHPAERMINQLKAFRANKNVMLTIENPDTSARNERFIRVPAKNIWRQPSKQKGKAMAKKRQRAKQVSKGITHTNPNRLGNRIAKEQRREYMQSGMRHHNQLLAYMAGKKVMLTIPNPNTNETNKRFIRVPANEVWKTVRRK